MSEDRFQSPVPYLSPKMLPYDQHYHSTVTIPPPASIRIHQRSRTNVDASSLSFRTPSSSPTRSSPRLPFLDFRSTRSLSPERVSADEAAEFDIDQTPTREPPRKRQSKAVEKFASWFEGTSEPVNITLLPTPWKQDDMDNNEYEEGKIYAEGPDLKDLFTRRPQKTTVMTNPSASTSRFSFFKRSPTSQSVTTTNIADDLATLDIREALFPHGLPIEFSPAALKNLQLNAEGTLRKFQLAHIEQQKTIISMNNSKFDQEDELEAANTRNDHLKFQLTDMAEKATEQERVIAALKEELAAFRNQDSGYIPQQSIRMVSQGNGSPLTTRPVRYRRQRSSDISTSGESEEGSDMSSVVSIFSDAMSLESPATSVAASPTMKQASPVRYGPIQRLPATDDSRAIVTVPECQKCHGASPSEAWDLVAMMKMESTALKERITELEGANLDALSFLGELRL